jgi:uncharacterized repeat protein (TIGR01451 family)
MSRQGLVHCLAPLLAGVCASWSSPAWAQARMDVVPVPNAGAPPALATTVPVLPPEIQVVRFRVPDGVGIEVIGPRPEPLAAAGGQDPNTFGLRVGEGYRLRLSNLPHRPGVELYPVVEVVGHLHRPTNIDPARFPIRINFTALDLEDAVDRGRLVTQIVYLEDPDKALPMNLPKEEVPLVTLTPSENPLKVASALGRVMAIVRLGGRVPTTAEWGLEPGSDYSVAGVCPFAGPEGGHCRLPCGPARGTPPPQDRAGLPRDEYLCDGGDHAVPLHFGGDGNLQGIDPRDAAIQFNDGRRPRVLPTNVVCIFAPRFAAVRVSIGPNEWVAVEIAHGAEMVQGQLVHQTVQPPKRLTQNQTAEAFRYRARPASLANRLLPGETIELRVLDSFHEVTHIAGHIMVQGSETIRNRQKAAALRMRTKPVALKTAESAVVTGIVEGTGEQVMAWKPRELAGVETPPHRPGMAVLKRISAAVAEPGDVVTISIQYRNMGNVPIAAVSVVDSLMPRLAYVPGSAKGPAGTVFTAAENRAGSTELRWDLPGAIAPGAEGFVSFQATVR